MMSENPQSPTGALTSLSDPPGSGARGLRFADRHDAGRRLAELLAPLRSEDPIVVALPRGGVPVAAEVARSLGAPMDVVVVRKLGAPQNTEYALGALAEGGVRVLARSAAESLGLSEGDLGRLAARCERELDQRVDRYRGGRAPLPLLGRTVIVVDDGLATGRSALAAVRSVRRRGAARVVLAVPVAAPESVRVLREEADEVVALEVPPEMWAVGVWYTDFAPTTDAEVLELLRAGERGETAA